MKETICFSQIFLSLVFLLSSSRLYADDFQFTTYSMSISRLELELALFDYEVEHQRTMCHGPLKYILSTSSIAPKKNQIVSAVSIDPALMKASSFDRRKRLNALCSGLFNEYKKRFHLNELKTIEKPEDINDSLFQTEEMKPENIILEFFSREEKLAAWKNGAMTYQEAFFK